MAHRKKKKFKLGVPRPIKKLYRIRFFLIVGILAFIGYQVSEGAPAFFLLLGPPIFAAQALKDLIANYVSFGFLLKFMSPGIMNNYVFLLPVSLIYAGLIGFLFKKLQAEHGFVRFLSVATLALFLCYIHFRAWQNIIGYYGFNP